MVALQVISSLVTNLSLRRPGHFVLLLQPPPGVGEPGGHLSECHFGDDSQHDLLPLGGVRVLAVLVQPCFQGAGGFPCCVLSSCCSIKVYCPVSGKEHTHTHAQTHRQTLAISVVNEGYQTTPSDSLTPCCLNIYPVSLHATFSMEFHSDMCFACDILPK